MDRTKTLSLTLAAFALLSGGCGTSKNALVVGSKDFTEQVVLGEIIAQHLEHRLGRKVTRKLNLGGTLLTYQAIQTGQISLYPEYTGTIQAEILKEQVSKDPAQVFERSRQELRRLAMSELFEPLGIDDSFVMVIRGEDARRLKIRTLSQAAQVKEGWKLGVGYEFEQRLDGSPALSNYHLPLAAPTRTMNLGLLYKALEQGQVTMIAANATDGPLAAHDWTVLEDDQKVFGSYQACVLARQDILSQEPAVKPALAELSGKFTNQLMQKLNAAVDVDHRPVGEVAAEFLTKAGLK
jgi:glycine betaine/choline ABC-type transport system substrate-binding protein